MAKLGTIYLVGAGPGDPALITVKGLALLREATAIVANTLRHAALLREAHPEAELHDTGSFRRGNKQPAEDVIRLLIKLAKQGKTVVRLWDGDPFVYSCAAQEITAATQAGLRVEVVPGVTSATAALAYAGVPVTDWNYAASFTVVSGFVPDHAAAQPDWTTLAKTETLVVLMPIENLPQITAKLQAAGRLPDTPAIAIQSGTLPSQKRVIASLATIAEAVEENAIESPAVVAIGDIVRLAHHLDWFQPGDNYPLLGQRVLVTRPQHQAADFMADLRLLGAEPISFPTIEILPAEDPGPLDAAILRLATPESGSRASPYSWLVLTSVNGVAAFWDRLAHLKLDSRCLAAVKIAAIGPATAEALNRCSIRPDLVPEVYTAEGVLDALDVAGSVAEQRFLLARADIARKTLAEGLVERGAIVEEFAAYRTVPVSGDRPPPFADIVTFTSSSTVQGYVNCLAGQKPAEALRDSQVVCIGPITAGTAQALGVPVAAVAEEYTIAGMLDVLKALPA